MRHSTLDNATSSSTPVPLLIRLKDVYSALSKWRKLKMSLTSYMKQLEEELVEEDVKLLQKKVKESEDFSNSLEYLFNSLVPSSWPMSGFSHASYNFSFPIPYSNFLELNSTLFHSLYVPYSSCDDLSICVQKGYIIDTEIDNPHYFGKTNFISFENHAHLPICASVLRPNTKRHPSKEERSAYWLFRYGIGKRKKFTGWLSATKPPMVTSRSGPASTSTSFNLVSYLYETFVPDNIFSDLL